MLSRSLRSDPLSPYLLVLCIERLTHGINETIAKKEWKPTSLSRGGPLLTHLFFTDNLLLFAKATESQVEALFKVLILSAVVRDKRLTRTNLKSCSPKIWKATVRGS